MDRRLELQKILERIIGEGRVYFQPPVNVELSYPCIVYSLGAAPSDYADNRAYRRTRMYDITVIDPDPDTVYMEPILDLPMTSFDRFYTADDLNHFVFSTYI